LGKHQGKDLWEKRGGIAPRRKSQACLVTLLFWVGRVKTRLAKKKLRKKRGEKSAKEKELWFHFIRV